MFQLSGILRRLTTVTVDYNVQSSAELSFDFMDQLKKQFADASLWSKRQMYVLY